MFKILIAEDDRELRQLFAHVLTKNGYTVLGVSNGEEALAALEQSYYDLIISDIMMPKMDGYELVRSIRESGSSIPIMMITAKDAFDDMRLGFLSGSDDYMVKPINIGEMVLRVSALLRRAQMASERRQVIGGTVMECDSLSVTVDGESMVLPQKEFMLLSKNGFDIELLNAVTDVVRIPVIASGGCGRLEHFSEVFLKSGADAALAASLFHYRELTVEQVKEHLEQCGIPVRKKRSVIEER